MNENGVDNVSVLRKKISVGDGINLTVLIDGKLKTNSLAVRFISPLTEENAAKNAAVPFVMDDTCEAYPDITSFNRRLSDLYGANVTGGIRRFVGSSVISFSCACIADKYALGGEKITLGTLSLLMSCIFEPVTENGVFPEKHFLLKKQELLDAIDADINDKRLYALKRAGTVIFENEPSGIAIKGEREAAAALTSKDVFEAYRRLLSSARIEMTFVGKELSPECEKLILERFSAIERKDVFLPEIIPSPIKEETRYFTDRLDIVQSKMVMAMKFKSECDDLAVAKVFSAVYGSTPFSKLFKNVREKLSLCYYCSCSIQHSLKTILIDSGVESENIVPAREEILRQLEAVRAGDFTDELLAQSKLYITASLKAVNDSPRVVSDWYFIQCLKDESKVYTPEEHIEAINAVTKEQVCDFAKSLVLDTVYVLDKKEV